jgi:hypothetical protein
MRATMSFAVTLAPVLLCACAGPADTPSRELVIVNLGPTALVAGEIGRAFLVPEGEGTRVQIEVSGVPPQVTTRPVHLYTYIFQGSCGRLGAQPAYALVQRVMAESPSGRGSPAGPSPCPTRRRRPCRSCGAVISPSW